MNGGNVAKQKGDTLGSAWGSNSNSALSWPWDGGPSCPSPSLCILHLQSEQCDAVMGPLLPAALEGRPVAEAPPPRPQCLEQHQARGVVNPRLLSKQTEGFVRHADSAQNLRRKDAQHLEAQLFLFSAQPPKVTLPHDRACP